MLRSLHSEHRITAWQAPIDTIKRSEIVRLLDRIEDESGPVMADHTLAVLRRLMSLHASRSDDFRCIFKQA